jgi:hypothetical protein
VGVNRQVYRTLISGVQQQAIFPVTPPGNAYGLFYNFHSQVFQPRPNQPLF